MALFDSILNSVSDTVGDLQKSVSETCESAANSVSELAKNVSEGAGNFYDSASSSANELYDSFSKSTEETVNEIQEFAAIKFYEVINNIDYADSIQKLKETQEQQEKDLSVLIGFLENLQTFAIEGKKRYLDKTE